MLYKTEQVRKVPMPFDTGRFDKVEVSQLKKGEEYVLTGDFYPDGGSIVKLVKFYPAKETWRGSRGKAAMVRRDDSSEYHLHPNAYLFKEKPHASQEARMG